MLKPFLIVSAAILFVFVAAPATGGISQDTPASTNPVKPTAATQERAKNLYARDCALCHGDNGNGKTDVAASMQVTLDDWTSSKTLASKSDQQLYDIVRKGKGEKMPPEEGRARNDEIWSLITYIRALSKTQAAPVAPAPEQPAPAAPATEQPAPATAPAAEQAPAPAPVPVTN